MQSKHGKSHKGRREYRILRNVQADVLGAMDADGWKREHTQFRPDGALDVVFSRIARTEKTIDKGVTVVVPAIGAEIPNTFPTVGANMEQKLVLLDKPKNQREGQVVDNIIAQLDADSMARAIEAGNEFYENIKDRYPTLSFTEWQNLKTVAS